MKISYVLLLALLLMASPAYAKVCGYLEVEDGSLQEVRKGKIYNFDDDQKIADGIPGVKKVSITNDLGLITITTGKNKKKQKITKIQLVKAGTKKKLTASVLQASSLVYFDSLTNSFVWIKIKDGLVARAKVTESTTKLKFKLSHFEFFSKDSCKYF